MNDEQEDNRSKTETRISFKKKIVKNLRRRIKTEDSDESEDEVIRAKLNDLKEIQKLRERPNGVSLVSLAVGKKITMEDEIAVDDPFKVQLGGMVNMQALKSGKVKQVDDAYDTGIGTQFSVETNKRDEDEEMMKYIEEQLAKRKGNKSDEDSQSGDESKKIKYCSPEEAALQAVPSHLRESSMKRSEEMLSNQMLSGIPEVDLGIEAKIKNIEATEEAKSRLLWEKHNQKDAPSQFVPSNMAVNFVQHSRFNVEDLPKRKHKLEEKADSTEERSKNKKDDKATDDYHYERFRKQFRRY